MKNFFQGDSHIKPVIALIVLSCLFFIVGNGILSLTNPDEVFYTQTAKEMVQHNSWMVPYLFGHPQFEKPILLYWFLRIGFIFFGANSFAARFFPAVFGLIGVLATYSLSFFAFKDKHKAFISGLVLMSCGIYIGLARTVFTDMIFSVFILLSLASFFRGYIYSQKKAQGLLLMFIFSGLAVLTKGLLGFCIPSMVVLLFLTLKKDIRFLFCKHSLWGLAVFVFISFPWHIFMILKFGKNFIQEYFYNDHIRRLLQAEHLENDRWYFYPVSIIGAIFPWSLFLVSSLIYLFRDLKRKWQPIHAFIFSWICVVLLAHQFAHSKLVSYIFCVFPALALLIGDFIYEKIHSGRVFLSSLGTLIIFLIFPIVLLVLLLRFSVLIAYEIPVIILLLTLLFFIILFFVLLSKQKRLITIYGLAFFIPLFLYFIPLVRNDIEPYVSSKSACEYLLNNYQVDNTILCAKPFVRGVRYYTDKPVAVMDIPGTPFFSPHPIEFLNNDDKMAEFFRKQIVTYGIVKYASLEDLDRVCLRGFKYTILKKIGNEYVLKIEYSG